MHQTQKRTAPMKASCCSSISRLLRTFLSVKRGGFGGPPPGSVPSPMASRGRPAGRTGRATCPAGGWLWARGSVGREPRAGLHGCVAEGEARLEGAGGVPGTGVGKRLGGGEGGARRRCGWESRPAAGVESVLPRPRLRASRPACAPWPGTTSQPRALPTSPRLASPVGRARQCEALRRRRCSSSCPGRERAKRLSGARRALSGLPAGLQRLRRRASGRAARGIPGETFTSSVLAPSRWGRESAKRRPAAASSRSEPSASPWRPLTG